MSPDVLETIKNLTGADSKYYSGVGSRECPIYVCKAMTAIALFLETEGYILRSGGANGADLAFENGVKNPNNKNIFLPWEGFNNSDSSLFGVCEDAITMATTVHPTGNALKKRKAALSLHARNCYQVLGKTLASPSDFLICWTENAKKVGGTRTAIVLAERNGIPILNLGKIETYSQAIQAFEIFYMTLAT